MNYITFDIETYNPDEDIKTAGRGRIDVNNFRVSCIGAYFSWLDEYLIFWEDQAPEFCEIMKKADFVVGYNHIWFDLPVLQKYASFNLKELKTYDLMVEVEKKIGYKLRLNDLAIKNLDIKKTDSFEHFRTYHLEGKWYELSYYCAYDVKITEELFQKVLNRQALKFADMLTEKEVLPDLPSFEESNQTADMVVEELF